MTDDVAAGAAPELGHGPDDHGPDGDHEHDADGQVIARADALTTDASPAASATAPALDPGDASLLGLVDRLGSLLDRSELSELAVKAGQTRLILRKPIAIAAVGSGGAGVAPATDHAPGASAATSDTPAADPAAAAEAPARPSVKAPLTGVWYGSPAPGSAAVRRGRSRGCGRPGDRPDRGHEALQRDQVRPRRAGGQGRPGQRRAGQGEAAPDRGGTAMNEASAAPVVHRAPRHGLGSLRPVRRC